MLHILQEMRLKLLQKEQFRKQQKQLVIWLVIKLLTKVTKVSKNSQQNNSETVTNQLVKEIPKKRYISPEERQEVIDELRLKS